MDDVILFLNYLSSENKGEEFKCKFCSENYPGQSYFLKHRKSNHRQLVQSVDNWSWGLCVMAMRVVGLLTMKKINTWKQQNRK